MDKTTQKYAVKLIELALEEDLGGQVDCTTWATIPKDVVGKADFVSRDNGVVCGLDVSEIAIRKFGDEINFEKFASDGETVEPGTVLASMTGTAREILTLERTCLNFLGRLSGIASLTHSFVKETTGTKAVLLDTRKTTPGWRHLEKYAVQSGGGANHRMGLYDAILIKDNHIAMCGALTNADKRSIEQILNIANQWIADHQSELVNGENTIVQIEVDNLDQLDQALACEVDIVLLDNMSTETLEKAVEIRNKKNASVLLEASGGVNLNTVGAIARTGVDRISVGALTHSAVNFDIGLDWRSAKK